MLKPEAGDGIASDLLMRFKTIGRVITTSPERLGQTGNLPGPAIRLLGIVNQTIHQTLRERLESQPILGSHKAVLDYCQMWMAQRRHEHLCGIFLNGKNRLLDTIVLQEGTINEVPIYAREIVRWALDLGATSLILVHNHPSDDVSPSVDDIEQTRELAAAMAPLGLTLIDHIIIGDGDHRSFQEMCLL